MRQCVVGFGQVGRGVKGVLGDDVVTIDKDSNHKGKFDVLHICFPYSAIFREQVLDYVAEYSPRLVIIHSTVAPGTTSALNATTLCEFVHSPVRGRHPDMANDMRVYTKYFGGPLASEAASIFGAAGLKTHCFPSSETTELGKLLSNIRWGLNLAFAQEQQRMCKHFNVKYEDVVNEFENSRNEGLGKLNRKKVTMPVLYPGVIGGHCVMPNVEILMQDYPSVFLKVILESNEKYGTST